MKNTEILGITNPLPQATEQSVSRTDEMQQQIDEQIELDKQEREQLAKAGYDYYGTEQLQAILAQAHFRM